MFDSEVVRTRGAPKSAVSITVDHGPIVSADLAALLISLYVLVDDLLPGRRRRFGRPVRISDSELICLAVAQVLLDCPNERRFLRQHRPTRLAA